MDNLKIQQHITLRDDFFIPCQVSSLLATNRVVNVLDSIQDRCYPKLAESNFLSPTVK